MRVVLAPTAFKGRATPAEAARAMAAGWRRARRRDDLVLLPMADGGDGTAEVLRHSLGGRVIRRTVPDPLGRPVLAAAVLLEDGRAVVETAAASGLVLVAKPERDPMRSDTRGTGELVAACIAAGATQVLLGLGGSATTDGGAGCAFALGVRFLDGRGLELEPCPRDLLRVADVEPIEPVPVTGLTDVANPLLGSRGAAAWFGPQKGATPAQVRLLGRALARLARASGRPDLAARAGSGAAGGLGFGVLALLGGSLVPGGDAIADAIGLDDALTGADLVITGEGRLDRQTLRGKAPAIVARRAAARGVPCVALVGETTLRSARPFSRVATLGRGALAEAAAALANSF